MERTEALADTLDTVVRIRIDHERDDAPELLLENLQDRRDETKIRDPETIAAVASLLVSGSTSIRLLIDGLIAWNQQTKATQVIIDRKAGNDPKIYKVHGRPEAIVVLEAGQKPLVWAPTEDPSVLAALLAGKQA